MGSKFGTAVNLHWFSVWLCSNLALFDAVWAWYYANVKLILLITFNVLVCLSFVYMPQSNYPLIADLLILC